MTGTNGHGFGERAAEADRTDPLAEHRAAFLDPPGGDVVAYFDGNSLGRPLAATRERLAHLVEGAWGTRLIRSWDEGWLAEPTRLGDRIGRAVLGAAAGQTVVGDSTSVLLYKWLRAAVAARPGRTTIVVDPADFPTDRFVAEGVARELGLRLVPVGAGDDGAVALDGVAAVLDQDSAVVLLSHVAFRSAQVADVAGITAAAHRAGALTLWDLSHSAGVVPLQLDRWGVDLAVGCTYKYLNGGPGAPAFGYVRHDLVDALRQPIEGWMGTADPFAMGEPYSPAADIRRFVSGTPPIIAMAATEDMLDVIERAGLPAIRRKSEALTAFVVDYFDAEFAPLGVRLASPRDAARRGGHVTLDHPAFRQVVAALWRRGVIPDFRPPDGLRIGLSPLSTSFAELHTGLTAVREELVAALG